MSRRFTVSSQFRPRRRGFATVPFLRMSGRWLAEAGFPIGRPVAVRIVEGNIVISAL